MFEKVNPSHPDKIADRIAGAIVDLAYEKQDNPKIAVEVLIGHKKCHIIAETSVSDITADEVTQIVNRITNRNDIGVDFVIVPQDVHLAENQAEELRCGDNGIFCGMPITDEQRKLKEIAEVIYDKYKSDGKYILNFCNDLHTADECSWYKGNDCLIICQSNTSKEDSFDWLWENRIIDKNHTDIIINPLGEWVGGTDVDCGATNRKLGSDMGDAVTGGGLCLSGDSEFLSDDFKWYPISGYKNQKVAQWNNGNLEFVSPLKFIHNKNEELYHIYNDTKLSMCVTGDHELIIETSKGNLIRKNAKEIITKIENNIGNSGSFIHSFSYERQLSSSKFKNEFEYRLQVAFCADGTILNDFEKKWSGRIRVKKEDKKNRLKFLFENSDIPYTITNDGDYLIFWFNPIVKSKSLRDCFVDESWDVLYDEIFNWDGDVNRKIFRTTNKEDADFIQLVIHSKNRFAKIHVDDRVGRIMDGKYITKSILYSVSELKSTKTHIRQSKSKIYVDKHIGDSYCFTVPSHALIIRHNNRIFITGNCGKDLSKADVSINIYAHIKAQIERRPIKLFCAIGDTIVDEKPYSEIVEIARNYIRSIGGFEKFAEWGLI